MRYMCSAEVGVRFGGGGRVYDVVVPADIKRHDDTMIKEE